SERHTLSLHDALPILKPTNDPDIRYSISENTDSQGRELSEKQQEFFADSMARVQEDGSYWYGEGNLVPVFHATSNEFTVFDRERSEEHTSELQSRFDI